MYVVLSGECVIRARPAHAASIPQQQPQPTSTVLVRPQHENSAHDNDSDTSEEEEPSSASLPSRVARSEAEHSSSFWTHKYMQQVFVSCSLAHSGYVLQLHPHEICAAHLPALVTAIVVNDKHSVNSIYGKNDIQQQIANHGAHCYHRHQNKGVNNDAVLIAAAFVVCVSVIACYRLRSWCELLKQRMIWQACLCPCWLGLQATGRPEHSNTSRHPLLPLHARRRRPCPPWKSCWGEVAACWLFWSCYISMHMSQNM